MQGRTWDVATAVTMLSLMVAILGLLVIAWQGLSNKIQDNAKASRQIRSSIFAE